jgi:flavin reductase (DIM6/NTAB) family NADH-FMN oxidoreductase RutF
MKEKDISTFNENFFELIEKDYGLLTAGTIDSFNAMTISWAAIGTLWRRNTFTVYVRPSRFTYQFLIKQPYFTVSFFPKSFHDKLTYLGSHSGRDEDKIKKCNLTPIPVKHNAVTYSEARLTFVCKKLFETDFLPEDISETIKNRFYLQKDYHRMFIGEIVQVLSSEE